MEIFIMLVVVMAVILTYVFIGSMTHAIMMRLEPRFDWRDEDDYKGFSIFISCVWPIMIPASLVLTAWEKVYNKVAGK